MAVQPHSVRPNLLFSFPVPCLTCLSEHNGALDCRRPILCLAYQAEYVSVAQIERQRDTASVVNPNAWRCLVPVRQPWRGVPAFRPQAHVALIQINTGRGSFPNIVRPVCDDLSEHDRKAFIRRALVSFRPLLMEPIRWALSGLKASGQ